MSSPNRSLVRDVGAGITTAIANVPDSMANAVLAGLNPVSGLYALLAGTPSAAFTTSSEYLTVAVTGAMSLAVGDALRPFAGDVERLAAALVTLTVLVGIVMITLGLLKASSLMRFVSNGVMRGFLTGAAVSIVLSQIPKFLGSTSAYQNKLAAAVDAGLHVSRFDFTTLLIGAFTIGVVLVLELTRLKRFAVIASLVLATAGTALIGADTILVSDVSAIPQGIPIPMLPNLGMLAGLIVPAFSIALIGLVQGAGIGKSLPNPDGRYPSLSRDFIGQGVGNVVSGVFKGMPVGGSVSGTALNTQSGATSRRSNLLAAPIIAVILIALFWAVEMIPMTSLAAILVLIGIRAIDVESIVTVWMTGLESRVIMAVTFAGVLLMPVQYAVLLGVAVSVVAYVYSSSLDIRIAQIEEQEDGRIIESPAPKNLTPGSVTILRIYGSVFYAGAQVAETMLPDPTGASGAIVILRLRGREDVGSTFLEIVERYRVRLAGSNAVLMLSDVEDALYEQLSRAGYLTHLGEENVFRARPDLLESTRGAMEEAARRLADSIDEKESHPT